ncbi:gamma-aminobutyric acid type B receptor subunit 1 [Sitophilus oryzae]|uniref:Gamma-aminobutyric acid type B receptor subunit 1 n=1 Tax=Sitophilus oryzae TaxID=7048 RepID=A0A6J2YUJ2_SITOR|nr:gamma-aminobutyric acid type B receptor subunit 1 [Sitophilus oryzae]
MLMRLRTRNEIMKRPSPWLPWTLIPLILALTSPGGGGTSTGGGGNALHIGGIFPIAGKGGWQGGQACMPAARLALEDVNARKDLLPGYKLKLHSNDSECEPGLGASVMYNLLYNEPTKLMLLAGCSTVCTTVAEAAKMWNLVVLCYGASSPALSDRNRFPTLFRTHPSATVHNPTRIKLMKKFGWSRVAILQQAEEVFISTVEDLESRCSEAGIEIVTRQSFLSDPSDAVRNLRRQDARVIVGLFYVVAARRVLCELYKHNLYGKSYTWFFIGWYEDNWFEVNLEKEKVNCSLAEMRIAAEGHLTTEALMWNQNKNERTISGMTSEDFRHRLNDVLRKEGYDIENQRYPEGYQEAPLAYDAVWSVALAFNKTMDRLHKYGKSLKDFNYNNKEIADDIYSAINSTQFLGVSGIVAFSSQGDRIALTQIEQVVNGSYVVLGYYDTQADNLTWFDREVWKGGKVPQDRTIIRKSLRTLSLPLFICMCAVSCLGIVIATGLIIFNIWNKHRRVIQSSHPVCNTIMLFGIIICFISVFFLGLDGHFVSPVVFPIMCQARAWLMAVGFTLSFGAMFSKVWRVHRLSTKAKTDPKVRMKKVQPWKLYSMVSGLLVIDIIIMLAWQIIDPLYRKIEMFPLEDPPEESDDSKIRPELEHCGTDNISVWYSIIFAYKGLVLSFGLFLAYETRSLKVKQINDSQYVALTIYNVVIMCLITVPVSLVITSQQDASFAFVSIAITFCCFLCMALIFLPKVIAVVSQSSDKAESKYNPDERPSKEDEERYQKLLSDNEELQRLIAQKEERIKVLRHRLQERQKGSGSSKTIATNSGILTQGKDTLIVADFITDAGTSDSAFGGCISVITRSSRCSQSDIEFSDSYL